jgi:hypothetical protein
MNSSTDSLRRRRTTWTAGLIVAAGAGVATAHGLYQVAAAARVPAAIAWLYPLITDGLALVAYAATARLRHGGRRYAAGIVVLAAGLSGLAQAVYLAGGIGVRSAAPVGLRFGVGAWPAIAAALTAHLLHLISTDPASETGTSTPSVEQQRVSNLPSNLTLSNPVFNDVSNPVEQQRSTAPVQRDAGGPLDGLSAGLNTSPDEPPGGSARERAHDAARHHVEAHGGLPTVTELAQLAGTSRGTAGTVLKDLREQRPSLHVINTNRENGTHQ